MIPKFQQVFFVTLLCPCREKDTHATNNMIPCVSFHVKGNVYIIYYSIKVLYLLAMQSGFHIELTFIVSSLQFSLHLLQMVLEIPKDLYTCTCRSVSCIPYSQCSCSPLYTWHFFFEWQSLVSHSWYSCLDSFSSINSGYRTQKNPGKNSPTGEIKH